MDALARYSHKEHIYHYQKQWNTAFQSIVAIDQAMWYADTSQYNLGPHQMHSQHHKVFDYASMPCETSHCEHHELNRILGYQSFITPLRIIYSVP